MSQAGRGSSRSATHLISGYHGSLGQGRQGLWVVVAFLLQLMDVLHELERSSSSDWPRRVTIFTCAIEEMVAAAWLHEEDCLYYAERLPHEFGDLSLAMRDDMDRAHLAATLREAPIHHPSFLITDGAIRRRFRSRFICELCFPGSDIVQHAGKDNVLIEAAESTLVACCEAPILVQFSLGFALGLLTCVAAWPSRGPFTI